MHFHVFKPNKTKKRRKTIHHTLSVTRQTNYIAEMNHITRMKKFSRLCESWASDEPSIPSTHTHIQCDPMHEMYHERCSTRTKKLKWHMKKETRLHVSIDSGCQDITSRGLKSRIAFNKWISISWKMKTKKENTNQKRTVPKAKTIDQFSTPIQSDRIVLNRVHINKKYASLFHLCVC